MERFVALIFVVALIGAGCGGDSEGTDADLQPRADVSGSGTGAFDDLPRIDGSRELAEATETGDVISQSFDLTMTTPLEVVRFYRTELPRTGWRQIGTADAIGGGALRGRWFQGDVLLEVSAGFVPTIGTEVADEPTVRYSLELRPVDNA